MRVLVAGSAYTFVYFLYSRLPGRAIILLYTSVSSPKAIRATQFLPRRQRVRAGLNVSNVNISGAFGTRATDFGHGLSIRKETRDLSLRLVN